VHRPKAVHGLVLRFFQAGELYLVHFGLRLFQSGVGSKSFGNPILSLKPQIVNQSRYQKLPSSADLLLASSLHRIRCFALSAGAFRAMHAV